MRFSPSLRSVDLGGFETPATLRGNPGFLLLWAGQSVSNVGDWINFVAINVLVFQLTGTGFSLAILRATHAVPELILGALVGVYVDRWDRKSTMIAADVTRAVLVALMAVGPGVGAIYALSLGVNVAAIFFGPAKSALIPNLVHRQTLTRANGLSSTTQTLAMVFGSSIGGIAIATVGLRQAFYLDAASFVVSALCLVFIRCPRARPLEDHAPSFRDELAGGWRELRTHPLRRGVTLMSTLLVLGPGVSTVLAVVFAERVLHAGTIGYSVLVTAMGVGAVASAVLVSLIGGRIPREVSYRLGFALAALGAMLIGVSRALPPAALGFALLGAGQIAATVSGTTLLQEHTPDALRGRVFGFYQTIVHVFSLLAAGIAGALADPLGAAVVILGVGLLEGCLSPLGWMLVREPARREPG